MTTISAKVIADSFCEQTGKGITTLQLRYPRFIHAEFMTHRQFSRNASSSRAIPVRRMIDDIIADPAMPMFWGKNQKGMQAGEEHDAEVVNWYTEDMGPDDSLEGLIIKKQMAPREDAWAGAMYNAIHVAKQFDKAGYHKQIVNRLIEPFMHINVLVTSTEWSNFFALRDHKDAEPHIQLLAQQMRKAMDASVPQRLGHGQWHLPYITPDERRTCTNQVLLMWSTARCARVSYLTHDGVPPTIEQDNNLYHQLVGSDPLHASPSEHQATPDPWGENRSQWGNFSNFIQHRKTLQGECK